MKSSDVLLERLMQLHPKLIDLSLDRMYDILGKLGNPHHRLPPVIHVAGTNGKGSAIAYMRAALLAAGYRVHVYTSPHLVRFHERVELYGEIITEPALAELLDECERRNGGAAITYFEVTTAAAFLAFSRNPADILFMETGLGGRLDATNVVDRPLATAITPVSLDHQQFLGNTLPEIAREKAGIIKPGVPLVVGPQENAALDTILARAKEVDAPATVWGRDFEVRNPTRDGFLYVENGNELPMPAPVLLGFHQPANAATAIATLRKLDGFDLSSDALATGLTSARWPARMQQIHEGRLKELLGEGTELWLDGGHNPAAGEVIADMAKTWNDRPLDIVVGMMNTKDPVGFLALIAPFVRLAVAVDIPREKNTLAADQTLKVLCEVDIAAEAAPDIETALRRLKTSGEPSRVLICGSLYLAGWVLEVNG